MSVCVRAGRGMSSNTFPRTEQRRGGGGGYGITVSWGYCFVLHTPSFRLLGVCVVLFLRHRLIVCARAPKQKVSLLLYYYRNHLLCACVCVSV